MVDFGAFLAAVVGLLAGVAAAIALRADNRHILHRLVDGSIPLLAVGVLALAAAFVLARRGDDRGRARR